jgi:hypothetical protein
MNEDLRACYERRWSRLADLAAGDGVSRPLFVRVPDGYEDLRCRLMIVGQQTQGWARDVTLGPDPVGALTEHYRRHDLGRNEAGSPFWQAAHLLHARLNPGGPARAFAWSTLVKLDRHGGRPDPELEEALAPLELLQREVLITRPHAVVFFTGPGYDERLQRTFPGLRHVDSGLPFVSRLEHDALPAAAYRSYHPGFLFGRGSRVVVERLMETLAESLAA